MKYLFVLGCPRSGTTMLQQALNRHSEIVIPPETKYFFSFLGHCRECQQQHIGRLNSDLGIELPRPTQAVKSHRQARNFYSHMAALYLKRMDRTNVTYFGDKTPEHTGSFPEIHRVFPEAKFLLIYRDGRDVALSLSKVPWMQPNVFVNFAVWLYYHHKQRAFCEHQSVYPIRYEELARDPLQELSRITDFLELPFERAMAEGYGNAEGIPAREYPWKAKALERITTERVGVWRKELTAAQVGIMERFGGKELESAGYELVTRGKVSPPFGFYPRFFWDATSFLCRLPFHALSRQLLGYPLCFH